MRFLAAATCIMMAFTGCTMPGGDHLAGLPTHWDMIDAPPAFDGGGPWLNTDGPITVDDLDGRVFMVDFWTYSCVNCIRTFPHLDGLYNTYKDLGFAIIGVHSPEFEFEEDTENVREGIAKYGIDYPVVQDNDFAIWRAYQGTQGGYWPAHFLFDADGDIRGYHRGEGAYVQTEELVRELLREAGHTDLPVPFEEETDPGPRGIGRTPELYAGYGRQSTAIGNPEGYDPQQSVTYAEPTSITRDKIYFEGTWFNGEEALTSESNGTVTLLFRAGAANFVADGPVGVCIPVRFDNAPAPVGLRGKDVSEEDGTPCIRLDDTPRSYDFYAGPFEDHIVEFDVPVGFSLYTFAFSNEAME